MKRLLENNHVILQFVCPISELLEIENHRKSWGITITGADGERSAFIQIGNKSDFEKSLIKFDDDSVKFIIFYLKDTEDEVADELFNTIIEEEDGFVLNGEYISHNEFTLAIGSFGEREGKRLKHSKVSDVDERVNSMKFEEEEVS